MIGTTFRRFYRFPAMVLVAVMAFAVAGCLFLGTMSEPHVGHGDTSASAAHILHSKEMGYGISVKAIVDVAVLLSIFLFAAYVAVLVPTAVRSASSLVLKWRDGLLAISPTWHVRSWLSLFVRSPDNFLAA